jgi:hypothetical protein
VLAANRNPVADPMPAETMFPLSELDRILPLSDTALHTAAGSERGRRSSRPSVSSRGTRTILKEPETRRLKNRGHLAIAVRLLAWRPYRPLARKRLLKPWSCLHPCGSTQVT